MDPLALTLIELGAVVFCLGLLARLAGRIGMSPIPLYLVGGLAFGAGGLVKLEGMHEFAHLSGEIGVILLLLMLGLEYTAAELFTGLRRSWQAGVLDLVLNFLPGAAWPCSWAGGCGGHGDGRGHLHFLVGHRRQGHHRPGPAGQP